MTRDFYLTAALTATLCLPFAATADNRPAEPATIQANADVLQQLDFSDRQAFEFHPQAYAPARDYDGRFGHFDFQRH